MRLKIFKSFFVTTACILFITLTLLFVIMSFAINGYIADSKRTLLVKSTDTLSALIQDDVPYNEVLLNTKSVGSINELSIFISNDAGQIFLCSCDEFDSDEFCPHSQLTVSAELLAAVGETADFKLSTMQGRFDNFRYVSAKKVLMPSADRYAYIFSTSSTVSVNEMLKLLLRMYAISAIIPLLLMFFAEYILTYRLTKPLKYMSAAAKSIAKGDFSKRVPVMSDDEIGELSVLFNRMSDSLSKNELVRRNFISNVSHELKTPMTTIGGFIDGIIDGTIDESRRDHYLKVISEEVKRLSRLVQSMLSISRLESDGMTVNPTEFDFAELAVSVIISMEQKITDKNLSIEGLGDLSHTVITADKDMIYQVVYNLVDNAVKYSDENGSVFFASHRIADKVVFSVRNTGAGIAAEDIPYVFERFYKADKSRSDNKDSLGLGLYITKTIVDTHDGTITASSVKGEFTEFKVTLPVKYETKSDRRK